MAELLAAGAALGIASGLITNAYVGCKVVNRIKECSDKTDDVPAVLEDIHAQLPVLLEEVAEIQRNLESTSLLIRSDSALAMTVTSCGAQIKRLDVLTQKMLPSEFDYKTTRAEKGLHSIYYERELRRA